MRQTGLTPIVPSAIIGYAHKVLMNADVGTDAPEQTTARSRAWLPHLLRRRCRLTGHILRELVCSTTCEVRILRGCLRRGRGKNRERYEEQTMKKIVVWGGLLLALGTVSKLLWQVNRVSSAPCDVPPPLPPCMYTYKDVTVSLN